MNAPQSDLSIPPGKRPSLSADRFKALADGIFSVALTLLIMDVVASAKMPSPDMALSEHLLGHIGIYGAFCVGFLTIFVCWINHHAVMDEVDRLDRSLTWVGGLQLGLVCAVPLPTALLADHFTGPSSYTAFFLYGMTFFLMASSFWALSATVLRHNLLAPDADRPAVERLKNAYLIAVFWNVLCIAALNWNVLLAAVMWTMMFGLFAFPNECSQLLHDHVVRRRR